MATLASNNIQSSAIGNYDLVRTVKLDFTDVELSMWRSRVTGLTVVHLDYEGETLNSIVFNDSGCPHTLEHLVFMGSEKYPYKGIIDHFANRGFSNGTNAWTDTDHTAYTISTAGEQGFMQLLPIFVDHILYPTITQNSFLTEVHHIDPKGRDSGVVYSEMQGRENTSGDLMALRFQRTLNPKGSAYRSETGGLMSALRILTVEESLWACFNELFSPYRILTVRNYHHTYYVPHNLTLIVGGKLSSGTKSLLSIVNSQVEPSLIDHKQNQGARPPGWRRPFVETPSSHRPAPSQTVKDVVEFPEKDESLGELILGFLGPPFPNFLERKALDILSTGYLTGSATAPLTKEYVETSSPLCTYLYFSEETRASKVDIPVYIGSIPVQYLDSFPDRLKISLQRIVTEGIDMERMAMVIRRDRRQIRSKLESAKGDTFSGSVISDFLYGKEDGSELASNLDEMKRLDTLAGWSSHQWTDLLQSYYIDPHPVIIQGKPSAKLIQRLDSEEKARIQAQVDSLGPEGLERAAKALSDAQAEHDKPIPKEIIESFPVPNVQSIEWISVQSVQDDGQSKAVPSKGVQSSLAKHISQDGQKLSFFVQYDHVKSDFVTVHAFLSLRNLSHDLRLLIPTYLGVFFALPVTRRSGHELTHEQVIDQLDDETVSYDVGFGLNGSFPELLRVSLKVETEMYAKAVAWIRDLLHGSDFDVERLQVTVAKLQQALPEMKRDGSTVLGSVYSDLLFDQTSTGKASGLLSQMEAIPKLATELQQQPDRVVGRFQEIRRQLLQPSNIRFSVAGDILSIPHPREPWKEHFGDLENSVSLQPVPLTAHTLSQVGQEPVRKALVVRLPTIESTFATHVTKCFSGFTHPDYPALRVAMEVLNGTESFLWRYIRGSGLAYGAYTAIDLESGLLSFSLYRSSNSMAAFEQGKKVVEGLVDQSITMDATSLDAAKSSIVYAVTRSLSTASRAAVNSFNNQALKGVTQEHNVELLAKYQAITQDEVLSALKKYFMPLFDSETSAAVVVTAPAMFDEISDAFGAKGFDVQKTELEVDPSELSGDMSGSEEGSESGSSDSEGSRG